MNANCKTPSKLIVNGINISIHVLILFAFLSAFFVYFISVKSKEALGNELDHNIKLAMETGIDSLSPEQREKAKEMLAHIPYDFMKKIYSEPHETWDMHNKWLFRTILIVNVALFIVVVTTVTVLMNSCGQCIPLKHILMENAIIFSCIGVVEYFFFTKVALKFIPVKPSVIVTSFLDSLKKRI